MKSASKSQFSSENWTLLKLRGLGDTVFLRPWIQAFCQRVPGAKLRVIIPRSWLPVLEDLQEMVEVVGVEPKGSLGRDFHLWRQMRKADGLVVLHSTHRLGRLARWSFVQKRVCHHHGVHETDTGSTVKIPDRNRVKSVLERDFDSLRALGLWGENEPALSLDPGVRKHPAAGYTVIIGEASRRTKIWPYFPEFVSHIQSPVKWIRASDQKPLAEVLEIVAKANLAIGNDTGLLHWAVACGVPTLAFEGPENIVEWHPHDSKNHPVVFAPDMPCRAEGAVEAPYCSKRKCDHHSCLTMFSPLYVINKWKEFLENHGCDIRA